MLGFAPGYGPGFLRVRGLGSLTVHYPPTPPPKPHPHTYPYAYLYYPLHSYSYLTQSCARLRMLDLRETLLAGTQEEEAHLQTQCHLFRI